MGIGFLIFLVFLGLIVGALARLALPGRDPMSIGQTILVGMAGSLVAGIISRLLLGRGAGIVLAVLFSTGIVYAVRKYRGGTLVDPGPAGRRLPPR